MAASPFSRIQLIRIQIFNSLMRNLFPAWIWLCTKVASSIVGEIRAGLENQTRVQACSSRNSQDRVRW
jgi:hypothetical protein